MYITTMLTDIMSLRPSTKTICDDPTINCLYYLVHDVYHFVLFLLMISGSQSINGGDGKWKEEKRCRKKESTEES